jgi:hypothetical protein
MGESMQHDAKVNLIDVLLEHLHEEGTFVLASPEDANFFRMEFAKKASPPPKAELPEIVKPLRDIPRPSSPKAEPLVTPKTPLPSPIEEKKPEEVKVAADLPKPKVQEPPPPRPITDFRSLRSLFKAALPEVAILDEIPSDFTAKKISERWKTKNQAAPISVLCWQEPPEQRALLEQIARALDIYFDGARIIQVDSIEKEKQWEAFLSVKELRTIVVCDYTLWQ